MTKDQNQTLDLGSKDSFMSRARLSRRSGLQDYKFKTCIGSGSTSVVYLAENVTNHKHYAIKVIQKRDIRDQKEIDHIREERKMLENLNHPFLIRFHHAFQTGSRLHLILEFANGGDLFGYLLKQKLIPESHCKFYAAEILTALEYLHENGIIFRGLKPEDVLLDSCGHVKLSDFGLAKSVESTSSTFCGSPLYLAPEVIIGERQTFAVDYWSFGVLLYEMLCGAPPFWDEDGKELLKRIMKKDYELSQKLSGDAKDLISKLLELEPTNRLGSGNRGIEEIKSHDFFKDVNWRDVVDKRITPPFVPLLRSPSD